MPDQQSDWAKAGEVVGGISAFAWASYHSVRALFKARNTNHADRIFRLERERLEDLRVMTEVREQMEQMAMNVDIRLGSSERRIRQLEVNANDLDREIRDNLQRMMEQMDRRLRNSAAAGASHQQEPSAQS